MTFSALLVSSDNLWIWALVGAGGGLVLFYRGFRLLQRKRLILNTPTSKIRSASLGLVEVNGLAVGPYTMRAPITTNTCYYYRTKAWEYRQSGKSKEWRLVADESLHVPFFLDDNTGKLLISPDGAEMDIHRDFHEEYSNSILFGNEMPQNVRAFLMRHGVSGDHKVRVEEYCIKPKNALFILGTLAEYEGDRLNPSPVNTTSSGTAASFKIRIPDALAGTFSSAMDKIPGTNVTRTITVTTRTNGGIPHQQVIQLSPGRAAEGSADMTQQGKIAAALIRAGISNPAAWAAAGIADPASASAASSVATLPSAETAVNGTTAAAADFDLQPKVVLMKGKNNAAFLISWRSEREVVQRMGWKSLAYIWCGPVLTLLSVYVLLQHFGLL